MLILKSSPRQVKMLCSLLLYKELPQEVCWQCSRIYTVTLSAILTPWTQQEASGSAWSSSFITWHCLSQISQIHNYSWNRIHLYHCASGLYPWGWLHFPRRHKVVLLWKIPWRRAWQPTVPMDRAAWRATVHSIVRNWTWLKRLSTARLHYPDSLWHPPSSCTQAVSTHHGDQ